MLQQPQRELPEAPFWTLAEASLWAQLASSERGLDAQAARAALERWARTPN